METTTNLELKKPDVIDRALIGDINDNMDIIDEAIGEIAGDIEDVKKYAPTRQNVIDGTLLDDFWNGTIMGVISSAIHGAADTYGVVRAYDVKNNVTIQVAEFEDGTVKTRSYSLGTWHPWVSSSISSAERAQIETNKNDISSLDVEVDTVANLGAKNLLDFNKWASNIAVYNGTKSYSNGILTVTATDSSCVTYHNQYFLEDLKIPVKEGEKYVITWDTTVTTNIGFFQLCPNGNAISGTDVSIANKQVEYTVASGVTYLTYRVGVWASKNSINISKLMLRPASISDSTYRPYALPNSDLTTLSAEDRAALVEIVDSGAKNCAFPRTLPEHPNDHPNVAIVQDGGHVEISGTTSNSQLTLYPYVPSGGYSCEIPMYIIGANSSTSINYYRVYYTDNGGTKRYPEIGTGTLIPQGSIINNIYVQVPANTTFSINFDLMVCTKAAWDISHLYQPYRPSYQELYERVVALEQANQ